MTKLTRAMRAALEDAATLPYLESNGVVERPLRHPWPTLDALERRKLLTFVGFVHGSHRGRWKLTPSTRHNT